MRNSHWHVWLAAMLLLGVSGCSKSSPQQAANSASPDANSASNTESTPATPPPVTIPQGKVLTVTLDQRVGTKIDRDGDIFRASLAAPVTVDGEQVLPAGTRATGTVVRAKEAGHVKGGAVLELTGSQVGLLANADLSGLAITLK